VADPNDLLRLELIGGPGRVQTAPGSPAGERGIVGVDVSALVVEGDPHTVVQLLFDDDTPGFDRSLLDAPLLAELRNATGDVVVSDLFDHHEFRRRLLDEQQAGGNELRGVLVLPGGELPPPYVRLAFLPVPIEKTTGAQLAVVRTDADSLRKAIDDARRDGNIDAIEHRSMSIALRQRHP
jgi:hypothetical protein